MDEWKRGKYENVTELKKMSTGCKDYSKTRPNEDLTKTINLHIFVRGLHGFSSKAHVFEDFCVGVGVLQSLPLELDGGQRPVNLSQLLLVPLFPLQGL